MLLHSMFDKFLPKIKSLDSHSLYKETLLTKDFLIDEEGSLSMYYSPHNEYINPAAKIVIIGITPGWKQIQTAYKQIINYLQTNHTEEQMLKAAKIAASFSGQMRINLVQMLDSIGLANLLDIPTTERLFTSNRFLIHTTSVIKYPVFHKGKNYTGYKPTIDQSSLLTHYAYPLFAEELNHIDQDALLIPLGKVSENVLDKIRTKHEYVLTGFPHPSGANGHRHKQFSQNKRILIDIVNDWAKK